MYLAGLRLVRELFRVGESIGVSVLVEGGTAAAAVSWSLEALMLPVQGVDGGMGKTVSGVLDGGLVVRKVSCKSLIHWGTSSL